MWSGGAPYLRQESAQFAPEPDGVSVQGPVDGVGRKVDGGQATVEASQSPQGAACTFWKPCPMASSVAGALVPPEGASSASAAVSGTVRDDPSSQSEIASCGTVSALPFFPKSGSVAVCLPFGSLFCGYKFWLRQEYSASSRFGPATAPPRSRRARLGFGRGLRHCP